MSIDDWREFVDQAMLVPFKDRGRDWRGWDCWGLCVVAYRELLHIKLPDLPYESIKDIKQLCKQLNAGKKEWRQVTEPELGDVALIYRRGLLIHTGLVSERGYILHTEESIGTMQQPQSSFRIEGFYVYG